MQNLDFKTINVQELVSTETSSIAGGTTWALTIDGCHKTDSSNEFNYLQKILENITDMRIMPIQL